MSGIAGAIDLTGNRLLPEHVLRAMSDSLAHRGPDGDGAFRADGVALAGRRLGVTGVSGGGTPVTNENGSVHVVFNGALFNYPEKKAELEAKGHRFRTPHDAELVPHLWEEHGDGLFEHLRGQFAFALYDARSRRVVLARDRFGICPLHWAKRDGWLLFGSEIKALLASGLVPARPDRRGINHAFTFFALPGPITCFEGVSILLPGHFLDLRPGTDVVRDRVYWEVDFPDQGDEDPGGEPKQLVERFEEVLLGAVQRRLRADVPPVACLSGGVDSGLVTAMASKLRGSPIPSFTIRIGDPELDETSDALLAARHIGTDPVVVHCGSAEVLAAYPRLIVAAEGPVIDTACAALLLLAQDVNSRGHKIALTGEGADEWMASYPWYKVDRLLGLLDAVPGLPLSGLARQAFLRLTGAPRFPPGALARIGNLVGGHNGWLDVYGVMSMAKLRFYSEDMRRVMADNSPYADLGLNAERLRRWHPLHRALALGARVHLPGLLLQAKGDRITMHSGVENRYAFLDEEVFSFLARLHPRWKLRGLREKYLLRLLAERWLPKRIAWKRKALFRAPFDGFHAEKAPPFVEQLFSAESLRKTGYFDADAVRQCRETFRQMRPGSTQRTSIEMGLAGVLSTQLWHHLYIDASLADLSGFSPGPVFAPKTSTNTSSLGLLEPPLKDIPGNSFSATSL